MNSKSPLWRQPFPNGYYAQTQKQPQPGILPPVESLSGFAVITLRKDFDVQTVGDALAAFPSAWNPPYIAQNDVNPVTMTFPPPEGYTPPPESIWTFAQRTADRYSPTTLYCNIGIGTHLYKTFFPDRQAPKNLRQFKQRVSKDERHEFPATGGDLFIHIKSSRYDLILSILEYAKQCLIDQIAEDGFKDKYCFGSIDGRNQFGFFDATSNAENTANPTLDIGPMVDAYPYSPGDYDPNNPNINIRSGCGNASLGKKEEAAKKGLVVDLGKIATTFIGEEDSNHLNGSFCIVQEFIHDLGKFNKLSTDEQSRVFGRQKESGGFYSNEKTPLSGGLNRQLPRAHIVRAHIRTGGPDGEADMDPCVQNSPGASLAPLQIYRQAASFGTATGEKGLFFVAYCRYCETFDKILSRMIGDSVTWPGSEHVPDHLLEYTRAISGQYFYMPNLEELASLANFPQGSK